MTDDEALYRTEVFFNAIYVIESLKDSDLKTGRHLFDDIIVPGEKKLEGLETKFYSVSSADDLAKALADIARSVHLRGRLPIVHFEAHGYDAGIQLSNLELVPWRALVPMLGDINRAARMNLVVVAIACMGANLLHALIPNERAPVFMLVGPPGEEYEDDLLAATREFYASIFDRLDINAALEAMNHGLPYENWRLKPFTSEILFCRSFRRHLEEGQTFSATQDEENALVADFVRRDKLDLRQAALVRDGLRRRFSDQRWWYDHLRRKFLWIDVHHDAERFGLTFDLCLGGTKIPVGRRGPPPDA